MLLVGKPYSALLVKRVSSYHILIYNILLIIALLYSILIYGILQISFYPSKNQVYLRFT